MPENLEPGRILPDIRDAVVEAIEELTPAALNALTQFGTFFAHLNRIFTPKIVERIKEKMEEG